MSTEARGIGSTGAGVTGNCESCDMGAGNQTWILSQSGKRGEEMGNLGHLASFHWSFK